MYGKQTQCAIAAMSRLAEVYDGGKTKLSAAEIAESRGLPRPFVSKILSVLSQAGLVTGSRGPGGGTTLAKPPDQIRIYDVFRLFEREEHVRECPFGGGICGVGEPCPIHDRLEEVHKAMDRLLHETTFAIFQRAARAKRTERRPTRRARGTRRRNHPRARTLSRRKATR